MAAAKGVNEAQSGPDGIPLLLDSLTAEFDFTVKRNGTAGLQITLLPVGGNASGIRAVWEQHRKTGVRRRFRERERIPEDRGSCPPTGHLQLLHGQ